MVFGSSSYFKTTLLKNYLYYVFQNKSFFVTISQNTLILTLQMTCEQFHCKMSFDCPADSLMGQLSFSWSFLCLFVDILSVAFGNVGSSGNSRHKNMLSNFHSKPVYLDLSYPGAKWNQVFSFSSFLLFFFFFRGATYA